MRTCSWVLLGAVLIGGGGCGKKPKEEPTLAKKEASSPAGNGSWGELLGVRPAGTPQTMVDVIKGFPGFETCIERVEKTLPPDLGADMLPYYDLPDVLCRTREAIARDEPAACRRVVSHSLRKGCEMMHAIYTGKPDLCPMDYPTRAGRSGYCLAMAQRDPSLCPGSKNEEEEARCLAVLGRDESHCGSLSRFEKRQQCKDEAKRWAPVLTRAKPSLPKGYQPSFALTLKTSNPNRPPPFERLQHPCANQGIVAPTTPGGAKVVLCELYPYGYRSSAARSYNAPEGRTKISFEFTPPGPGATRVTFGTNARITIKISGFDDYSGTQTGEITLETFEHRRGGRVKGSFKATLVQGADRLEVEGTFDSFIRDLVSPSDLRSPLEGYGYQDHPDAQRGLLGLLGSPGGGKGPRPWGKRQGGVLTSATLRPEQQGGRVAGYRITGVQPGGLWERLGVREGDLLVQVGSVQLNSAGGLIHLRKELQRAPSLRLLLRRAGRLQILQVSRAAMQRLRDEFTF